MLTAAAPPPPTRGDADDDDDGDAAAGVTSSSCSAKGSSCLMKKICRNASFFECFSLCLSRACLGKMIILVYKWRKKTRFLTVALWREYRVPATNALFFSTFPMSVPSLSWSNYRFDVKVTPKRAFRFSRAGPEPMLFDRDQALCRGVRAVVLVQLRGARRELQLPAARDPRGDGAHRCLRNLPNMPSCLDFSDVCPEPVLVN